MFRKIQIFVVTLIYALCFTLPAGADTDYIDVAVDVPPRLLFLGDSIATGYGLEGYKNGREHCHSYANQLASAYEYELKDKCETSVANLAIDGQTSAELLEKLEDGSYDDYLKNTDAVVVSIGGNDLLTVLWELFTQYEDENNNFSLSKMFDSLANLNSTIENNLQAFQENISKIASYIKKKTDAILIIQTLYNPFNQISDYIPLKNYAEEKISLLNDSIKLHKDDENAEYLVTDVYSEFVDKASDLTRIKSLDIHPNQIGHDTIFECVDKTIRTAKYSYKEEIESRPVQGILENSNSDLYIAVGILILLIISALIIVIIKSTKRKD